MTLRGPNIERMPRPGLSGMAEAIEERRGVPDIGQPGFDDRLAMLVEREVAHRDRRSYLNCLRQARPRIRADVRDVDRGAGRGIAGGTLTRLAAGDWIRRGINLIVEGPTGSGKTFLVCALAHRARRQKMSAPCRRVPELVSALAHARDGELHERLMRRLATVSLPVLDDWGPRGFSAEGRRDLPGTGGRRYGRRSIVIASQIPVDSWPGVIGEPTIADAVMDRIVHNAYRIELAGESRRRRNAPPPLGGPGG